MAFGLKREGWPSTKNEKPNAIFSIYQLKDTMCKVMDVNFVPGAIDSIISFMYLGSHTKPKFARMFLCRFFVVVKKLFHQPYMIWSSEHSSTFNILTCMKIDQRHSIHLFILLPATFTESVAIRNLPCQILLQPILKCFHLIWFISSDREGKLNMTTSVSCYASSTRTMWGKVMGVNFVPWSNIYIYIYYYYYYYTGFDIWIRGQYKFG